MAYCVVRTDLLAGTRNPAFLEHGRYHAASGDTAEIQNGSIVFVDALEDGERESHKYKDVPENAKIKDLVLIAAPEVIYDESNHKTLRDFTNAAGSIVRGYYLLPQTEFSVTAEGISGTAPTVGQTLIVAKDTHIMKVGAASDGTVIGKCTEIETKFQYGANVTYYTIKVEG